MMSLLPSLQARVVEALYGEALALADAARSRFAQARAASAPPRPRAADLAGAVETLVAAADDIEVACEALRTTTRIMHCLAWLLNHRAWFAGEISAQQLRRHGRLVAHFPASDPAIVARLPQDLAALIEHSERIYARIGRLEAAWRAPVASAGQALDRLHEELRNATRLPTRRA